MRMSFWRHYRSRKPAAAAAGVFVFSFIITATSLTSGAADHPILNQIFPSLADLGQSSDMTPIELCLKGVHGPICWMVPKTYLSNKQHWNGGLQDFIGLRSALYWDDFDLLPTINDAGKPTDDIHHHSHTPGSELLLQILFGLREFPLIWLHHPKSNSLFIRTMRWFTAIHIARTAYLFWTPV